MYGYYCYSNEIDGTLTCYYKDEICTYYPDGTVVCYPRAFVAPWGTPVTALLFITLLLLAILFVRFEV